MRAGEFEALVEAARAVLEQRGRFVRGHRLEEGVVLAGLQGRALEKRHDLVEHRGVAGGRDIGGGGEGEPDAIVGDPRAHALAGMRQPPMLDIAFDELPAGGAQQMARASRPGRAKVSAMPSCNWSRKP